MMVIRIVQFLRLLIKEMKLIRVIRKKADGLETIEASFALIISAFNGLQLSVSYQISSCH